MPNIGPRMADDLVRLGVRRVSDLVGRDPMEMYDAISALDGVRHDPCVLDTYMAVVDHATTGSCHPWWRYTPKRKTLLRKLAAATRTDKAPLKSQAAAKKRSKKATRR